MGARTGRAARADLVSVVEAAYRVDQHESAWIRGVREAVSDVVRPPAGMIAATYRRTEGGLGLRCLDLLGARGGRPLLELVNAGRPPAFVRAWADGVSGFASRSAGREQIRAVGAELGFDFREGFGIHAADPTGTGAVIALPLPSGRRPQRFVDRMRWQRIAAHIASGFRVQRLVASSTLTTEAVLEPGGRLVDAQGPAAAKSAREVLRSACQTVEWARTRLGRADDQAIERWTSLFGARWSLLDRFERDGRRYLVAVRNTVVEGAEPLTPRESQVVAMAVLGHSNKVISFELHLAHSTVRVLILRAARKLGVRTRAQLVLRAHELHFELQPGLDGDLPPR